MPTKRRRRAQGRRETVSDAVLHVLETGEPKAEEAHDLLDLHRLVGRNETALRAVWVEHREEILEDFIDENPGRRPWAWWKYDAPEPRLRLGGTGTPAHEVLAHAPAYDRGIPVHWITAWDAAYYSGHGRDIHGHPIGTEFHGRDFPGVAIDPDDPPRYESQAAYLDRHHLLDADERARLDASDFEPEPINPFIDEEHHTP